MNRTPPTEVLRLLRKEIGYGCPVSGCGNPYLTWHHFDPPWNIKEHHNPEGMIALCPEHHNKADAGAYTIDQLRKFKENPTNQEVKGKFDWLRNRLLAVVGGNFYFETRIILKFRGKPIIWFNRDKEGYLLINIHMLTIEDAERAYIEDNFWIKRGNPEDIECPPSGKLLRIKYPNGDYVKIEFYEIVSEEFVATRYPEISVEMFEGITLPITAVEIHYKVGGTIIEFGPRYTKLPLGYVKGCFFTHFNTVFELN